MYKCWLCVILLKNKTYIQRNSEQVSIYNNIKPKFHYYFQRLNKKNVPQLETLRIQTSKYRKDTKQQKRKWGKTKNQWLKKNIRYIHYTFSPWNCLAIDPAYKLNKRAKEKQKRIEAKEREGAKPYKLN